MINPHRSSVIVISQNELMSELNKYIKKVTHYKVTNKYKKWTE